MHAPHRPTTSGAAVSPARDTYGDVIDMFRYLATLDPDSGTYVRHRDAIVERCLPLADHIARRFWGRGESHDDLVQVARVGLVNAVNRFDISRCAATRAVVSCQPSKKGATRAGVAEPSPVSGFVGRRGLFQQVGAQRSPLGGAFPVRLQLPTRQKKLLQFVVGDTWHPALGVRRETDDEQ